MSDEAIRIECPGCHARFRLRKRPSNPKAKVRCTKCETAIPLPPPSPPPPPPTPDEKTKRQKRATSATSKRRKPKKSDAELRKMLLRAKKERAGERGEPPNTAASADLPDDTRPDIGAKTMPIGDSARTANQLGTDGPKPRPTQGPVERERVDTPRAGAMMGTTDQEAPQSDSQPGAEPERPPRPPYVDEPTYTGPMPGRTPKITPTDEDLARFLKPGNYMVRVEDVVYAPVNHEVLAKLVDAGTIVAVDAIATEGRWFEIEAGEPLQGVKARLSHRAHHLLAGVADKHPAEDFGRPLPSHEREPELPESADSSITNELPPREEPAGDTIPEPDATVQTEAPAVEEPSVDHPPKSRGLLVAVLGLFALAIGVVAIAAIVLLRPGTFEQVEALLAPPAEPVEKEKAEPPKAEPEPVKEQPPEPPDPTPAFKSAHATVDSAHAVADSIDGLLNRARELGDEEAVTTLAWMKWAREPADVDADDLIERLIERGDWKDARQVANWLIATRGETDELHDLVNTTLERQFAEETLVKITTDEFGRFVAVDTGHRPAIILEDKEGQRWRFWPDLGENAWRGDIAVYRLCQVMVCHFSIPETRPARIHKKTYRKLARASDESVREMVNRLRSDFDWNRKRRLSGSLRRVPDGAPWPVEATGIWRPWLTAGSGTTKLEEDVIEAHHAVAFFGAEKVYPELDSISARQLARQVSTMLLIDYLVGNWNRFAPNEDDWGSRTYVDDGLLESVDDSAAFLGDGSVRVKGRFSWTSRFSRAAVDSLDRLDPDEVDPLLFPDASKDEKEKLERMWKQRRRAQRRINKLIKKYGAEDVYALDPSDDSDDEGD